MERRRAGLVPGETDSTEYRVNVAEEVILAGADILLLPTDLKDAEAAAFYDNYISGLEAKVRAGEISKERIDESVKRILSLKEKHGILDLDTSGSKTEAVVQNAKRQVGSVKHHNQERKIAREAITLVKNDEDILPLSNQNQKIVFLTGREEEKTEIQYVVQVLKKKKKISPKSKVYVDYYNAPDANGDKLHYSGKLKKQIRNADVVIGMTQTYNLAILEKTSVQYQAIAAAIRDTHAGSGEFILLSNRLPYDAARFTKADAIILSYMSAGLGTDPTARGENSSFGAFNANVEAAIETVFGDNDPAGTLPVDIPKLKESKKGVVSIGRELLYERGFGLTY